MEILNKGKKENQFRLVYTWRTKFNECYFSSSMARVITCLVVLSHFIVAPSYNVVKSDTQMINEALDEIIQETKSVIVLTSRDQIFISDKGASFRNKWHFIHVCGSFKGTGSRFRSLSSIQRTGDTPLTTNGNRVTRRTG